MVIASRIADVPGVDLVGPLPSELQTTIGISAGVGASAKEPAAAEALIQFFTAPAAVPVLRAKGLTPP